MESSKIALKVLMIIFEIGMEFILFFHTTVLKILESDK
jgi:hypothetical protein